ncbi:MAG: hypothetical protein G8D91_00395 [gamma proteobacterium symbiont of Clathrolucina costata]
MEDIKYLDDQELISEFFAIKHEAEEASQKALDGFNTPPEIRSNFAIEHMRKLAHLMLIEAEMKARFTLH